MLFVFYFFGVVVEGDVRLESKLFPAFAARHFVIYIFLVYESVIMTDLLIVFAVWEFNVIHSFDWLCGEVFGVWFYPIKVVLIFSR